MTEHYRTKRIILLFHSEQRNDAQLSQIMSEFARETETGADKIK